MSNSGSGPNLAAGTAWDLSDLYRDPADPALEADLSKALDRAIQFEQDHRPRIKPGVLTPESLLSALKEIESIREQADKAMSFASLLFAADTRNPRHGALLQKTQERLTELRKHLLFFELAIAQFPKALIEELIVDARLAGYRHVIEKIQAFRPYQLPEAEEQLIDEKANTGIRAFSRLFDETVQRIRFPFSEGDNIRELSEQEVLSLLYDPDRERRRGAASALTDGLREHGALLSFIFNVVLADHASDDRLRRRPDPMTARNLENEADPASVDALLCTCDRNIGIVSRFYRLKQQLLRLDRLYDYDRYAPLEPSGGLIGFDRCREQVLDAFLAFSPKVHQIAKVFFEKHWIDAELREGKRGGAFCHGTVPSVHPYVLVNYTGRPRDVMTVAHELGHGIHQLLSAPRGYLSCDAPLTLAETASVFAEMLVFHRLKNEAQTSQARLLLLCEKIEDSSLPFFARAL